MNTIRFFAPTLSAFLTALTLGLLAIKIAKENDAELIRNLKEEHITIHYSAVYRWVGFVCTGFFLCFIILMTIFPNDSVVPWTYVGFSLFVLLGLYLILESYLWKIHIYKKEDYYDFTSSFGTKYQIFYADILNYKVGENLIKIKTKQNVFYIDTKALNLEYLLQMLKKNKVKEVIRNKQNRMFIERD